MILSSKAVLLPLIREASKVYSESGEDAFVSFIHTHILKQKVRFPLLEFASREIFRTIPEERHLHLCDLFLALNEIGSYVMIGIVLQQRLSANPGAAIQKAIHILQAGNKWYVCDIVGERVMGESLLRFPEQTLPILREMKSHPDIWVVRSVGVAGHYAIKKGLPKKQVISLFELLLSLGDANAFHIKKGIGWAAKTTAKFYPDLIEHYRERIENETGQWFKTKVRIGLGRASKYATRYSG